MTSAQLEGVNFLRKELRVARAELQEMRLKADAIKPALDGLPSNKKITSQVEELTIKIMAQEDRIAHYEAALALAKMGLMDSILSLGAKVAEQTVIILRYVEGLSFDDIALRTKFNLRHVFRLHAKFKALHLTA